MFMILRTICSMAMARPMYSPFLQVAQVFTRGLQVPQIWWPFLQLKICLGAAMGSRQTGQFGMSWDCWLELVPIPACSRDFFFCTSSSNSV